MRPVSMRRILSAAFVGLFMLVPQAHAAIDFESIAPTLFFGGDTLSENGFTMTQNGNFGVVDTAADAFFVAQPPSGNPTQFYAGLNDSQLTLMRSDGGFFRLGGFDAGFVAPVPQDPGVAAGRIQVSAIDMLGNPVFSSWDLGLSADDGTHSFLTFATPADFAGFGFLKSAVFNACVYVDSACLSPYLNLGQFALDNVNVVAIPEPATAALMLLGLAGLAARARRVQR
jgi:hypothetical protein